MAATTGYQAGIESNQTSWSYGIEATWNTGPATTFQAFRDAGDTAAGSKTRSRPSEILSTYEETFSVTTAEQASGTINYALSFAQYDDLMSVVMGKDWQAAQTIAGISGDISIANSGSVLSSTLSTKFANIAAGQYIKLLGFTNAANNGVWLVSAKADNSHLTLAGPRTIVDETPAGTAAQVRASTILNGTQFKSLAMQKKLSSSIWLRYGGTFFSRMVISGGVGQFLGGSFDFIAASESSNTSDWSTGGITAAPTGRVHDSIGGFGGVLWNSAAMSGVVDSISLTLERNGAGADYGMGNSIAAGMRLGSMMVTGTLKMFFKTLTEYALFKAETLGRLTLITSDPAGNTYVFSLPQAALMNPKLERSGPGRPVYVTFDIEGNPQSGGGTISIDRLPGV